MLVITVHAMLRPSVWVSLSAEEHSGCGRHHREWKHCLPGVLRAGPSSEHLTGHCSLLRTRLKVYRDFVYLWCYRLSNSSQSLYLNWQLEEWLWKGFVGLFFHQISSSRDEIYGGFLGSLVSLGQRNFWVSVEVAEDPQPPAMTWSEALRRAAGECLTNYPWRWSHAITGLARTLLVALCDTL